ncbi:DNAJ heat shock N-terminal domain-containing protein [Abeliophyllum distichum]|uniref:DNAJ heat shock N-terminal domain-containing protein n=1 Tax=Abeliophyllum distichum TaxID=126358 RepID=A0ABD1P016_9LAMI
MECNKDEAFRAKKIAEKKMENNDFDGAQKIALKAQNLFPELENIAQLLTVCNVHCSAQNRILGSEKDWYGILQVERLANELTIKRQYRRLALLLHPDKNKFHGAEAAFKLIGEANMVLSDPVKRSLYDSKIRVSVRAAPANSSHHKTNNPNGRNEHPSMPPNSVAGQAVFWTCCPFCSGRFQYPREYVNKALRCHNQNCSRAFIAYDLGAQGVPLGAKWAQPGVQNVPSKSNQSRPSLSEQKEVPDLGAFKMGAQNTSRFSASRAGSLGGAIHRKVGSESGPREEIAAEIGGDLKAKEKDSRNAQSLNVRKAGGAIPNGDAMSRKLGNVRNKSRKRGRKVVVESSESSDTSNSDPEDVVIEESCDNHETGMDQGLNGFRRLRRPAQQKQNVSCNISDDDDFASPPKRSRGNKLSGDGKKKENESVDGEVSKCGNPTSFSTDEDNLKSKVKEMRSVLPEGSFPDKNAESEEVEVKGQAAVMHGAGAEPIDIIDDSEPDSDSSDEDKKVYECPDPEFHDFDQIREENCFSVDQIWACYDTLDCMPRYYAQIKKIITPGFKLSIDWLEANPEGKHAINWAIEELPVGCGRFKRGKTEVASELCTFSHQVHFEKGRSRGSFVIFPRKGDIWALFKDWDIRWSSNPENHKHFKYEIVEVMSDFVAGVGITVAYLDKVEGFLSLFQRTSRSEIDSFLIRPNELLRFSHQIPFFKMTGSERKGVPEGSFELDPAALLLQGA